MFFEKKNFWSGYIGYIGYMTDIIDFFGLQLSYNELQFSQAKIRGRGVFSENHSTPKNTL